LSDGILLHRDFWEVNLLFSKPYGLRNQNMSLETRELDFIPKLVGAIDHPRIPSVSFHVQPAMMHFVNTSLWTLYF